MLIDLDGVLRVWPKSDQQLESAHGLPVGAFRHAAFEPDLILDVITGKISDETWRLRVAANLSRDYPNAEVPKAVKVWATPSGKVNEPVLKLVQRAREQVKVVLITNATTRLNQDLAALGLLDQFDGIVNSSEVGSAKPESGIYEVALGAAGVSASEAVFVDDQLVNVEAAAALGIRAVHFIDHEKLSTRLQESGVLGAAP